MNAILLNSKAPHSAVSTVGGCSAAGAWLCQIIGLLVLGTGVGLAAIPAYGEMLHQVELALPSGAMAALCADMLIY